MIKKSHAFALAVTTVGMIGFAAPMASAATMGSPVVNVANNQVPVQACGNDVNTNVGAVQVPAEGAALVGSLLSPGSSTSATSNEDRSCAMLNEQTNVDGKGGKGGKSGGSGGSDGSGGSLVNVSNNQIPIQACGNDVNTNVLAAQGGLEGAAGALTLLSPMAITSSTSNVNRSCELANSQDNWSW
jgi:hypothetical protein